MTKNLNLLAILSLAVGACHDGAKAALPESSVGAPVLGVRVSKPKNKVADDLVRVSGTLRAKNEATLGAPAGGTLARLYVEVGDRVKRGQALARLDTWQIEIGIEQAKAALATAQAGFDAAAVELARAERLRQGDAAPAAVLDRAKAAHQQAKAGLRQAQAAVHASEANLYHATLRAPFDGVITRRFTNIGETLSMARSTPVIGIVDVSNLEVRAPVPETVVDFIHTGTIAKATISPSGKTFAAKVYSVGSVVDQASRTVEVIADVTSDITPEMRPGAIVELDFSEAIVGQEVVGWYLPAQAIRHGGTKTTVMVVEGDLLEERTVDVEPVTPGLVRVSHGLSGQENVVIEGVSNLKAGTRVRAAQQS